MIWSKDQYLDFLHSKGAMWPWPLDTLKDTLFTVELSVLNHLEDKIKHEVDPAASWNLDRSEAEFSKKWLQTCVDLIIEYEVEDAAVIVPMSRSIIIDYEFGKSKSGGIKFNMLIRYESEIIYSRLAGNPEPSNDEAIKLAEKNLLQNNKLIHPPAATLSCGLLLSKIVFTY